MLFQLYGETAGYQLLGFVLVFTGLVLANEFARRTKTGGIICFLALPAVLTVYFIAIYRRSQWRRVGTEQPDLHQHEQLVPLCQAVCRHRGLHRLYDAEI